MDSAPAAPRQKQQAKEAAAKTDENEVIPAVPMPPTQMTATNNAAAAEAEQPAGPPELTVVTSDEPAAEEGSSTLRVSAMAFVPMTKPISPTSSPPSAASRPQQPQIPAEHYGYAGPMTHHEPQRSLPLQAVCAAGPSIHMLEDPASYNQQMCTTTLFADAMTAQVASGQLPYSGHVAAEWWSAAPNWNPDQQYAQPLPSSPPVQEHAPHWSKEGQRRIRATRPHPQSPDQLAGAAHLDPDTCLTQCSALLHNMSTTGNDALVPTLFKLVDGHDGLLRDLTRMIHEKAVTDHSFCELASITFKRLKELKSGSMSPNSLLKRELIALCQTEFERNNSNAKEKHRRRSVGNVKLMGELFKVDLLTEKIMHECIRSLLGDVKTPAPHNIEAVCQLLDSIGRKLDNPRGSPYMAQYLDRLVILMEADEIDLPGRVRFRIRDVLEKLKTQIRTNEEE